MESTSKYWIPIYNFKLGDGFSDVFANATATTTRLLDNPVERIMDISSFHTKGMKATDEQVLATVDGVICLEKAEKFRIIRSHMDGLALCKANLNSLFLSVAEK